MEVVWKVEGGKWRAQHAQAADFHGEVAHGPEQLFQVVTAVSLLLQLTSTCVLIILRAKDNRGPQKNLRPEVHQHSRNPLLPFIPSPTIHHPQIPSSLTQGKRAADASSPACNASHTSDTIVPHRPTLSNLAQPAGRRALFTNTAKQPTHSTSQSPQILRLRYLSLTATTIARKKRKKGTYRSHSTPDNSSPCSPHSPTTSKPIQPSAHTFTFFQTIRPRLPRGNFVVSSFLSAPVSPGPVGLELCVSKSNQQSYRPLLL